MVVFVKRSSDVGEPDEEDPPAWDYSNHLEAYKVYSQTLRTWFVGFGIGGPALMLVNPAIADKLNSAPAGKLIVTLFLLGAGAQVALALLNKIANLMVYDAKQGNPRQGPSQKPTRWEKVWDFLARCFAIDLAIDLATFILFGWAVWLMLDIYVR